MSLFVIPDRVYVRILSELVEKIFHRLQKGDLSRVSFILVHMIGFR